MALSLSFHFLSDFFLLTVMPVICPVVFEPLTPEQFTALDYQIMPHLFASHHELGRLCDESIYESDVKARLELAGFAPVRTQAPVTVSFRDFAKTYFLDLTVRDAGIYELKAVAALAGEHKAQLLNYLLLLGLRSGKLVNFRSPRVESAFISTTLTADARHHIQTDDSRWQLITDACDNLRHTFLDLLDHWGTFLELALYQEALVFFLGGEPRVWQRVELARSGVVLGTQRLALHGPQVAFKLTSLTNDLAAAETQFRRLLALTPLRAIQWLNLNRHQIQFITLQK